MNCRHATELDDEFRRKLPRAYDMMIRKTEQCAGMIGKGLDESGRSFDAAYAVPNHDAFSQKRMETAGIYHNRFFLQSMKRSTRRTIGVKADIKRASVTRMDKNNGPMIMLYSSF